MEKKYYVKVQFPLDKVDMDKLHEIEKLFGELGIHFDTGAGFGYRDWEWDWSLSGPIEITVFEDDD